MYMSHLCAAVARTSCLLRCHLGKDLLQPQLRHLQLHRVQSGDGVFDLTAKTTVWLWLPIEAAAASCAVRRRLKRPTV